jgi:hypothetical protein
MSAQMNQSTAEHRKTEVQNRSPSEQVLARLGSRRWLRLAPDNLLVHFGSLRVIGL